MDAHSTARKVFDSSEITRWMASVFATCGVPQENATLAASVLVRCTLRGIDTHGVMRALSYSQMLLSGGMNPTARVTSEIRNGVVRVDGDGGMGQIVATHAMREAIAYARTTAFAPCIIERSGHLDAIGLYGVQAAESGMIAFLCKTTPPLMAQQGSHGAAIGNNPITFGMPVSGKASLLFDMATSVTGRHHLRYAVRDKTDILEGWAIDLEGNPTTDPAAGLAGALLPIAGYKGVGLAMMVQCLAGSLGAFPTGGDGVARGPARPAGNESVFMLVINPDLISGREAFDAHVAQWLTTYLGVSGAQGRYPGQRAAECERERRKFGLPISDTILDEFRQTGELVGRKFEVKPLGQER